MQYKKPIIFFLVAFSLLTAIAKESLFPNLSFFEAVKSLFQPKIIFNFENHAENTKYNSVSQKQDGDLEWSNQLDLYGSISSKISHDGKKSLKLRYPSDVQSNVGASWILPSHKQYYLSYWVYFAPNFDFDGSKLSGGKLPGLGSQGLCSGGDECDGNNGFSSRYMWRENGKAVLYLYHMNKAGKYGDDLELIDQAAQVIEFQRGQWHHLVQRVRVNDDNKSNGEVDVWVDQEQVLSQKNLKFVTNGQGVDRLYFSTFHGGAGKEWWPSKDVYAYFDDFVISTKPFDVGL